MLAHPSRPLTRPQYLAKFSQCLDHAATPLRPEAGRELIVRVAELHELPNVHALIALMAGRPG